MASPNTIQLRSITTREEQLSEKWRIANQTTRGAGGIKLQPGKRHGALRVKKQGTSSRRARRAYLKTLPRSIRRKG